MKKKIASYFVHATNDELSEEQVLSLLEKPKHEAMGDIAFPCFTLAKMYRKAPQKIAQQIAEKLEGEILSKVEVAGGYINLYLDQSKVANEVLAMILKEKNEYGTVKTVKGNVVLDFSSPNIAKPFSMGHLRSTVIGNALSNIAEKSGYTPIKINHLGDWGTQFGKLIVAYQLWGNKEMIEQAPIQELLKLYVKFHEEAVENESLNEQARAKFKALEDGHMDSLALWEWFREESLKEFNSIYELLNIQFDAYAGEAFYNDKMETVIAELTEKDLLTLSDGAYVVEVENMPPCLIKKTDGATLYATRDLAAALYRQRHYHPKKIFYVVGNEQSLHFKQLFSVIEKMGYDIAKEMHHISFGMMLKDGKKMSTRKGKVVLLADVLNEAIETAKRSIEEKNPSLQQKDKVAEQVGVGAVIFNDLKNYRSNDIEFSLEQMMNFEGETGPYVQYTFARISSILDKRQLTVGENSTFNFLDDQAWPTVKLLEQFPNTVEKAFNEADPSQIAKFALALARSFNKYYAHTKILVEDEGIQNRLAFSQCVAILLEECLRLLGIKAPEKM